jgi:hypothetical protein
MATLRESTKNRIDSSAFDCFHHNFAPTAATSLSLGRISGTGPSGIMPYTNSLSIIGHLVRWECQGNNSSDKVEYISKSRKEGESYKGIYLFMALCIVLLDMLELSCVMEGWHIPV